MYVAGFILGLLAIIPGGVLGQARDCSAPADLYFVMDGSESVNETNYAAIKNFVVDVLTAFDVGPGRTHIGANVFGTKVYDRISLHGPSFYLGATIRLRTLSRINTEVTVDTSTYKAIEEMAEEFRTSGRPDVTWVAVVITDGNSINMSETLKQSNIARSMGINMIAVGIGDAIFRPELENIAGSNSSVYETDDIKKIVVNITDAIKDFTCLPIATAAPTKKPPVTPERGGLGNDFDCPDCLIGKDRGFLPHPNVCSKYIEVYPGANGSRMAANRKCPEGLFWDQPSSTCNRPDLVDCENDPCRNRAVASYDRENSCSGYIQCINGRSFFACCGDIQRYVPGTGCVVDPTCPGSCLGDDELRSLAPTECMSYSHPTDRSKYIEDIGNQGNITRDCAPGTWFSENSCLCSDHDDTPRGESLADCNPSANFTFDTGLTDTSGQNSYAGSEYVDIVGGNAVFTGSGLINIYRFSGDSFDEALVIRFTFQPSGTGATTQALVTNCVYSLETRASISITAVTSSVPEFNVVVFTVDTQVGTQEVSVRFNPTGNNDVMLIYDGDNLVGVVNGVSSTKAPLTGPILRRRSGIVLGAGSKKGYFSGRIGEFQLYKCLPGFADQYRV